METKEAQERITPPPGFDPSWIVPYRAAFGPNGMIALSWWTGTLFAELIRGEIGGWPVLEITGEQRTGKSAMVQFLQRCIGRDEYEGFDPFAAAPAARLRQLTQGDSLPVVCVESPRRPGSRRQWDTAELQAIAEGGTLRVTRGKLLGECVSHVFRGGLMITGNEPVPDCPAAVRSRMIRLHATGRHFSPEGEEAARMLNRMGVDALAPFIEHVKANAEPLLNAWREELDRLRLYDHSWGYTQSRRVFLSHAAVAAWTNVLPMLFGPAFNPRWTAAVAESVMSLAAEAEALPETDQSTSPMPDTEPPQESGKGVCPSCGHREVITWPSGHKACSRANKCGWQTQSTEG